MREITGMLTPQGLKIRLDGEFCEHLTLKGNITLNDLLKEVESFVCTGKWVILIVGIIAFINKLPNNFLFMLSFWTALIISLSFWIHPLFMIVRGIFTITQPKIFVILSGWFIDKILLLIIGFLTVGWKGLLFYMGGYMVAILLGYILNIFLAKSNHSQFGSFIQSDEKAFIFLCLRHMDRFSFMDWIKSYHNHLNS